MELTNIHIGKRCREYRIKNRYSQYDVAKDVGCSQPNVSLFELGRNDNMQILFWYVLHGMTFDYLLKEGDLHGDR